MTATAAAAIEPQAGSPLRKAILDALRPTVEARLKTHVEFTVQVIRAERGWAFVIADPRHRGGKAINGNAIFGEDFSNMDGLRVDAVLRLQRGKWRVVDHAIGATDVWHCDVGPRSLKRGFGC
jgi:hypothetical protein